MIEMIVEFLLGVGDGVGTVVVGALIALVRSWNSGYLRQYLDGRGRETEGCEYEQDCFENLVERVDSMEKQVDRIDEKIEGDETVGQPDRRGEENIETLSYQSSR
jgi:hypothetical protein